MGGLPNVYPGYQRVDDAGVRREVREGLGSFAFPEHRPDSMEMMNGLGDGKVKAMYRHGRKPHGIRPQPHPCREGAPLCRVPCGDGHLHVRNRSDRPRDPPGATSFVEKDGTFTNTERRVLLLREVLPPPGESRPDWKIICDLSTALGYPMHYSNAAEIMDEIATVTPIYGGIHHHRLSETGLQWPCPGNDHPGTVFLHRDKFSRGLGKFHPVDFINPDEMPDDEYPFILSTGRILFHYHTGTMSRRVDALNEYVGEGYAEIHPKDAARLGLVDGGRVLVATRRGRIETKVMATERVAEGSVFIPFHFVEAAANMLTNDALDPVAKIPEFKVAACSLSKVVNG